LTPFPILERLLPSNDYADSGELITSACQSPIQNSARCRCDTLCAIVALYTTSLLQIPSKTLGEHLVFSFVGTMKPLKKVTACFLGNDTFEPCFCYLSRLVLSDSGPSLQRRWLRVNSRVLSWAGAFFFLLGLSLRLWLLPNISFRDCALAGVGASKTQSSSLAWIRASSFFKNDPSKG